MLPRKLVLSVAVALLGTFGSLPAQAKITCCDVEGKRTCGDPMPLQCYNKAKTEIGKGGVAKEIEAPLTPEQREAREKAEALKKEEEKRIAEQQRRDMALLASYTSEKEIDAARNRAIADIEKNATQAKNRLDAAQKKKAKLDQEREFYKGKALPPALDQQVTDNESEVAAQQKILDQKDLDIKEVNKRYDEDKARFTKLKAGK